MKQNRNFCEIFLENRNFLWNCVKIEILLKCAMKNRLFVKLPEKNENFSEISLENRNILGNCLKNRKLFGNLTWKIAILCEITWKKSKFFGNLPWKIDFFWWNYLKTIKKIRKFALKNRLLWNSLQKSTFFGKFNRKPKFLENCLKNPKFFGNLPWKI